MFEDLNFRGQGQGQGQGLENWFSRILEDKDFPRGQQQLLPAAFNAVFTLSRLSF